MKYAAVFLLLAGCAPGVYTKADGTAAPDQVVKECAYEAMKATASATDANPLAGPLGGLHALTTNSSMRRARIEAACMDAKGYAIR